MGDSASHAVRFQAASDQGLIVYFRPSANDGETPDPVGMITGRDLSAQITIRGHEQVRKLLRMIELEPLAGVRNLHPGYSSLLIKFDPLKLRHEDLEDILRGLLERMENVKLPEPRLVEIPVCYGGEFGPDLSDVAELHRLTPERVIDLHASAAYIVYFLGFVPGFAYLGELPPELATPRLPTPRRSVPTGSVGIAGSQTGVYPISTPGGWRLLGRTPVAMFQPERKEMSLLAIGDRVRFVPISLQQFAKLENA
jgi:inhibitor of KinA